MDTIVTRPAPAPRRSWRGIAAVVGTGIAVLVAFLAVDGLVRDPDVVERIEIRNPTGELVEVLVRSHTGGALLPIALVEPERRAVADDVVDQGDRWTFVVRVADDTVARVVLTRDELARADWTFTIPSDPDAAASAPGG